MEWRFCGGSYSIQTTRKASPSKKAFGGEPHTKGSLSVRIMNFWVFNRILRSVNTMVARWTVCPEAFETHSSTVV